MFVVDSKASEFLAKLHNQVCIEYQYEASGGDGLLCSKQHCGCWVPQISPGPPHKQLSHYVQQSYGEITIYYPVSLKPRAGTTAIEIRLCKLWRWQWLELEGACSVPVFGQHPGG